MPVMNLAPGERDLARIVQAIRQLAQGRSDAVGDVTLATGAATTTIVKAPTCAVGSKVFLYPQTANAAAVVATTYVLTANIIKGQFTVTHAATANIDCTFSWKVTG